ncbi:hypothetical protein B484DRAFT_394287 [Ochromonadaceae sp. CCMP2298]|nr:hypothetical protein B484DRAFT_394287 [Ochromonadaceae sp. CCMP2298]
MIAHRAPTCTSAHQLRTQQPAYKSFELITQRSSSKTQAASSADLSALTTLDVITLGTSFSAAQNGYSVVASSSGTSKPPTSRSFGKRGHILRRRMARIIKQSCTPCSEPHDAYHRLRDSREFRFSFSFGGMRLHRPPAHVSTGDSETRTSSYRARELQLQLRCDTFIRQSIAQDSQQIRLHHSANSAGHSANAQPEASNSATGIYMETAVAQTISDNIKLYTQQEVDDTVQFSDLQGSAACASLSTTHSAHETHCVIGVNYGVHSVRGARGPVNIYIDACTQLPPSTMHSSETGHVRVLQGNKGNDCSHKSCRTRALNAAYAFEAHVETLYSNDVEQACTSILRMYYNREVSDKTHAAYDSLTTSDGRDVLMKLYNGARQRPRRGPSDPNTRNADMVQGYQTDEYGFSDSIESAAGPTLSKHHCPRGCTTRLLGA